jgi:hypothetical protein
MTDASATELPGWNRIPGGGWHLIGDQCRWCNQPYKDKGSSMKCGCTLGAGPPDDTTVNALTALPYSEYLATPHWQARRRAMLNLADFRCTRCQYATNLQVHHTSYLRLGYESPEDLTVLCDHCHHQIHDR